MGFSSARAAAPARLQWGNEMGMTVLRAGKGEHSGIFITEHLDRKPAMPQHAPLRINARSEPGDDAGAGGPLRQPAP